MAPTPSGPFKAILFDIDGTLIVSGGASTRAWNGAFKDVCEIEVDIYDYTEDGMTDPEIAVRTFKGAMGRDPEAIEIAQVMKARLDRMVGEVSSSKGYEVLPGVEEILPKLLAEGYLLGLTTGNLEASAHIKLARAGLNRYFSFGGFGSDASDRVELTKHAVERAYFVSGRQIEAADCLALGDTAHDVAAAHGAGIKVCSVASGKSSLEELQAAGPDWAIESLTEGLPLT
jgi:phosphoglycolate phosphatase